MNKEDIMVEICDLMSLDRQLAVLGNGSTEKREFLVSVAKRLGVQLQGDETKEVLVVGIFRGLNIDYEAGVSVSRGASVVRESMAKILEQLRRDFSTFL
jgi:hypothetical protein